MATFRDMITCIVISNLPKRLKKISLQAHTEVVKQLLVPSHFCDIQIKKRNQWNRCAHSLALVEYLRSNMEHLVNQTGTRGLHGMKLPFQNILQSWYCVRISWNFPSPGNNILKIWAAVDDNASNEFLLEIVVSIECFVGDFS